MTIPDSDSDSGLEALLVLRAQTGDRDALGELYERVGRTLARHLQYILRDDALAEDVLHDVFIIVHRKLRWLRDPATFRPWVFRIATREAIRIAKRQRSRPDQPGAEDYDWSSVAAAEGMRSQDTLTLEHEVLAAIPRVSAASRAVLSLHYLEGLTLHESAVVLDLPVGTVKSRLAAGITQIRRWFRREREQR